MGNIGQIVAIDRSAPKVRRIAALCEGQGFSCIQCFKADSTHLCAMDGEEESKRVVHEVGFGILEKWSAEAEAALLAAIAEHGGRKGRSAKRICKAVFAAVGRANVTREMVEERLKSLDPTCGKASEIS